MTKKIVVGAIAVVFCLLLAPHQVKTLPQVAPLQVNDNAIEALVNKLVRETPVRLFSKSYCPHSRQAKQILGNYQLKPNAYKITELDLLGDDELMRAVQDYMQKTTGARTVPRLFIGGQFIGGVSETVALHQNGQLQRLLREAGALATTLTAF